MLIRRSKLYYTASGIMTLCRWPFGAQVHLHGNVDVALSIVNPRPGMINPQLANSMLRLILVTDQLNAQILVL